MKMDQDNQFFAMIFITVIMISGIFFFTMSKDDQVPTDPIAQRIWACEKLFPEKNVAICLEKIKELPNE